MDINRIIEYFFYFTLFFVSFNVTFFYGRIKNKYNAVPGLAVVQVGNIEASSVYVKAKTKFAKEVGIDVFDYHLDDNITEKKLLNLIVELNNKNEVSGILVQLPLPNHINASKIIDKIQISFMEQIK